jgi:hypothetical protein
VDESGQLHLQAWDAYTGQTDRRCSGAQAHMLMAQLSNEASSSLHHQQRLEHEQGGGGDAAPAASSDTGRAAAAAAAATGGVFPARLRRVERAGGAIRQVQQADPSVLLLDINISLLLQSIAAITAITAPPAPPPAPAGSIRPGGDAPAAATAPAMYISRQSSLASVLTAADDGGAPSEAPPSHDGGGTGHHPAGHPMHTHGHGGGGGGGVKAQARAELARLREAALALALMHRWGLDCAADCWTAAFLREVGLLRASPPHGSGSGAGAALQPPDASPAASSAPSRAEAARARQQGDGASRADRLASVGDLAARLEEAAARRGPQGWRFGVALCQEACVSEEGALTASLPYRVRRQAGQETRTGGDANGGGGSAERLGALFLSNPSVLAVRWVLTTGFEPGPEPTAPPPGRQAAPVLEDHTRLR